MPSASAASPPPISIHVVPKVKINTPTKSVVSTAENKPIEKGQDNWSSVTKTQAKPTEAVGKFMSQILCINFIHWCLFRRSATVCTLQCRYHCLCDTLYHLHCYDHNCLSCHMGAMVSRYGKLSIFYYCYVFTACVFYRRHRAVWKKQKRARSLNVLTATISSFLDDDCESQLSDISKKSASPPPLERIYDEINRECQVMTVTAACSEYYRLHKVSNEIIIGLVFHVVRYLYGRISGYLIL